MSLPKIYINIPAGVTAGGVESLYQLADAINNCGGESLVFWDRKINNPIPEKYSKYNIRYTDYIEDKSENWVIYPEVWTEKLNEFKNVKKSIWWLSVDNNHGKFKDFDNSSITHFYQSYYALDFLKKNSTEKCLPLFDYVSETYISEIFHNLKKENIICYNPVKGIEFTNQLINQNPDLTFIPIQNMSEGNVIDLLKKSKVYIDFGHHPGRDRIPRESVLLGCCVLTNKKGSAGFYDDIPIDGTFKTESISEINKNIRDCFFNYDERIKNFIFYQKIVKNQKNQLNNLVQQYFL